MRCPHCGKALFEIHKRVSSQAALTKREQAAIHMIFRGASNGDIAKHFGTTEQVVKNCLRYAYRKLGVSGRTDLIWQSVTQGGYLLWTYNGEPYIEPSAPPEAKFETAAERHAANLKAKREREAAAAAWKERMNAVD